MTKKATAEDKDKAQEEREAAAAKRKENAAKKNKADAVTIEDAIADIEAQFDNYIVNVGAGVLNAIMDEVRKMAKDGIHEDKVDGQISLRMSKEGLKLSMLAKTQVVVKEVHKEEFAAITADPKQPELPLTNGITSGGKSKGKDIEQPPTETTGLHRKDAPSPEDADANSNGADGSF